MFRNVKEGIVFQVSLIDQRTQNFAVQCQMPKCGFGFFFRDMGAGKAEAEAKLNAHAVEAHNV